MKKYIIAVSAATAVIAGCGKVTVNQEEKPAEAAKYITVSTGIDTRVETTEAGDEIFSENDRISIYAWTGDAAVVPAAADRVVNNAINTAGIILDKAIPTAKAMRMSESTLPSRRGRTILFGTTERKCSVYDVSATPIDSLTFPILLIRSEGRFPGATMI